MVNQPPGNKSRCQNRQHAGSRRASLCRVSQPVWSDRTFRGLQNFEGVARMKTVLLRSTTPSPVRRGGRSLPTVLLAGFVAGLLLAAGASSAPADGGITRLRLDETAPRVELFAGLKDGRLVHRVVARDEFSSRVYLTNTTDQPLTVQVPPALGAVPILRQQGSNGFPDFSSLPINDETTSGDFQNVLGQPNDASGGPLGFMDPSFDFGGSFFSIPAEKTVQFRLRSVCGEPGQRSPYPKVTYVLVPLEKLTDNPAVRELLVRWNPRKTNRQIMQAAIWNQHNGLDWKQLASRTVSRGPITYPVFGRGQLKAARQLVDQAIAATKVPAKPGSDVAQTGDGDRPRQ